MTAVGLALYYVSKDGEEGFPGTLAVKLVYTLTNNNELRIDYTAMTDKKTVVNLSQHNYYNLAGAGMGIFWGIFVTINADRFTPIKAGLHPDRASTEVLPVHRFDFRNPMAIGARIHSQDPQMQYARNGYDFNYVLNPDSNLNGFGSEGV